MPDLQVTTKPKVAEQISTEPDALQGAAGLGAGGAEREQFGAPESARVTTVERVNKELVPVLEKYAKVIGENKFLDQAQIDTLPPLGKQEVMTRLTKVLGLEEKPALLELHYEKIGDHGTITIDAYDKSGREVAQLYCQRKNGGDFEILTFDKGEPAQWVSNYNKVHAALAPALAQQQKTFDALIRESDYVMHAPGQSIWAEIPINPMSFREGEIDNFKSAVSTALKLDQSRYYVELLHSGQDNSTDESAPALTIRILDCANNEEFASVQLSKDKLMSTTQDNLQKLAALATQ